MSFQFLISCGRFEEALAIFRGIYTTNTGKDPSTYPVKELLIDDKLRAEIEEVKKPIKNKYKRTFVNIIDNSKQLFQSPILKFTTISIVINFTFHIGYYGKSNIFLLKICASNLSDF
jgi:VNT family MFS transporter (synaptic vesicle glycoprotein 2)